MTNRPMASFMVRRPGSALLLTIMVVAIITSMALGGAALRYQQLSATDRIGSSSVAELAAKSGVTDLENTLKSGSSIDAIKGYDLDKNLPTGPISDISTYKPSPRSTLYTVEPDTTRLPRCLSVGVLSPWVSTGGYLYSQDSTSNPAMIFQIANIVNDTRLKDIPGNSPDVAQTVSSLTQMGHFYNPYAPVGSNPTEESYWTIKYNGPQDEFLSKKASDGVHSLYQGLDLLYIPYLPRFVDSGTILDNGSFGTISAGNLRSKFEGVITSNNLKVWLDASMTDDVLYQYGLGDLFVASPTNRLTWAQPTLWNDLPESSLNGPYVSGDVAGDATWQKQALPNLDSLTNDSGWDVDILRGARPFSFFTFGQSGQNQVTFQAGHDVTMLLYGSLEGLRINGTVALQLLDKNNQTYGRLSGRTDDQGKLYNVTVKSIATNGSNSTVVLTLSADATDTPQKKDPGGGYVPSSELGAVGLVSDPQFSTKQSFSSVTLSGNNGAKDAVVNVVSEKSCPHQTSSPYTYVACPALGDIVGLTKGSTRLWGVVDRVDVSGTSVTGFSVDSFRSYPKPVRDFAHTAFTDTDGTKKIALFGGRIDSNSYDGGLYSQLDELLYYTPSVNAWQFVANVPISGGNASDVPNSLYGSSLALDEQNHRLVLYGGSYNEAQGNEGSSPGGRNCLDATQRLCLAYNRVNFRLAQRFSNDVYFYDLNAKSWKKAVINADASQKITNGDQYTLRVQSSLADRSGKPGWQWNAQVNFPPAPATITINTSPGDTNSFTIYRSAAGFAQGDKVYLSGITQAGNEFRAWGSITAINGNDNIITVTISGYGGGPNVTLKSLSIQPIQRQNSELVCVGAGNGCVMTTGSEGLAVGDAVTLDKYPSNFDQIDSELFGYVSAITNNIFYFTSKEKDSSNDFTTNYTSGSALKIPLPASGANARVSTTSDGVSHLVVNGGSQQMDSSAYRPATTWVLDLPSVPSTQVTWRLLPLSSPAKPGGSLSLQVLNFPPSATIFTDASANNSGLTPTDGSWPSDGSWTVNFPDSDAASQYLAVGARISIERQQADTFEVFHGNVAGLSHPGSLIQVVLRHDSTYPGDTGLSGDSKNAKVTLAYVGELNKTMSGVSLSTNGSAEVLGKSPNSSDLNQIPRGAIVLAGYESGQFYIGKISSRTIGSDVRLQLNTKLISSPLSLAGLAGGLVSDGTTVRSLMLSNYQLYMNGGGFDPYKAGALEWQTDVTSGLANSNTAISWAIRASGKDNSVNVKDRPAPRQDGAGAIITTGSGSSASSSLFLTGATYGTDGSFWKETNAGKSGANEAGWALNQSGLNQSGDLPNLFGGGLDVYQENIGGNVVTKAVYFGGKQRFDGHDFDNATVFGPRILGTPETSSSGSETFTLADNGSSTLDGRRMIDGAYDALPSGTTDRDSFKITRSSIDKTCTYVGQPSVGPQACDGQQLRHLGSMGRSSQDKSDISGYTAGASLGVINPGSAWRKTGDSPSMILSGPSRSFASTIGRSEQEGYYPNNITDDPALTSDKTTMLAGFSRLDNGGSILVTTMGIGAALVYQPGRTTLDDPARGFSYCGSYKVDGSCDTSNKKYLLDWLPDPEDLAFTLSASQTLGQTDTYRVIGYYGGVRRAFIVNARNNVFSLQETSP